MALVAADVDSDGLTDLVTANRGANDVSVLLGADDGQFEQQFRIRVGRTPTGLAINDLDADGTLDLVTANRGSKTVTVMLNSVDAPQPVVCLVPAVARRTLAVARRLVGAAKLQGRVGAAEALEACPPWARDLGQPAAANARSGRHCSNAPRQQGSQALA